jgi:hypothetical protein
MESNEMTSNQLAILSEILAGLVLVFVVVGGSQIIGPRCGKYLITDSSVEFVLFGRLRVWAAAFSDITDVRPVSPFEMFTVFAVNLMNRLFAQHVLIRKRRGILRRAVITPDRPEEFIQIVREKSGMKE